MELVYEAVHKYLVKNQVTWKFYPKDWAYDENFLFRASERTIRRWFKEMAEMGMLIRVSERGGYRVKISA